MKGLSNAEFSVSHPNTQYVGRLLEALLSINQLKKFYTSFHYSDEKMVGKLLSSISATAGINSKLSRRSFKGIPGNAISDFPFLEIKRSFRNTFLNIDPDHSYFLMCKEFDRMVAKNSSIRESKVFIGYEMACEKTFHEVKKLDGQTVLDLAQIHYNEISLIAETYPGFKYLLKNRERLKRVNERKENELVLSDRILCLSEFAKESLLKQGIDKEKITTVNLGYSESTFYPKDDYNIDGKIRLLFVGTLTRRKGIDILLNVFKRMKTAGIQVELTLVGPMGDAKDLILNSGLELKLIPFTNPEGLRKLYQESDLFVFPSYLDSWAMVVIEAMACGTPVIISNNTGAKDAVVKGGGAVLETGDEEALYDCILKFHEDRILLEETGRRAAVVAQSFKWKNYSEQIISFCNTLTKN